MFVISVCGLCATTAVYLNWWPLCRDCFFYALSVIMMLITIGDEVVTKWESLSMLIMYVIYCVALHYNNFLERWAQTLPVPFKKIVPSEDSNLMTYRNLEEEGKHQNYGSAPEDPWGDNAFTQGTLLPMHHRRV